MQTETRHYTDGSCATGTAPLPALSPAQQDIRAALVAARQFVEWPTGRERMEQVLALIERALAHIPTTTT